MENKILYSIAATFNDVNKTVNAVNKINEEGFKDYDVHTPYPVHGLPQAMKLKPSKLGYVTLVFGFAGAIFAFLFMYWVNVIDYPLIVGGKPYYQLSAYIPVMFEVTVLSAAVFTVVWMLFIMFKFPNNAHPLVDTDYMKKVSVDRFGISIQARDEKFDLDKVKKLFGDLGAEEIFEIYYKTEQLAERPRIFDKKFISFSALTAVVVSAITYFVLNQLLFMAPFNWMHKQFRVNPQSTTTVFKDNFGMRPPVEGTVARGFLPYPFKGKPAEAEAKLINPLVPTEKVLELGKQKYLTYCSPCHGNFGMGDSRLRGQFPNPPTLHSDRIRNMKDGGIFHIITEGQNVMSSYASQLSVDERWAIVHYIRVLQRSVNPKESDLR
jgi:mono/diheme cytochrome c family protein